jgi:hypothetical protein
MLATPPAARAGAALVAAAFTLTGCSMSAPRTAAPTASTAAQSPEPTQPLLSSDDGHSRVGELAPGFPSTLLPVPAGAEILVSAARPVAGDLLEVSLNLRSAQDTAGLLAAIRAPLVAAGFVETAPAQPDAGLAAQSQFSRADGKELLVVGIRDDGTTRTLSIGGTVAAPAAG